MVQKLTSSQSDSSKFLRRNVLQIQNWLDKLNKKGPIVGQSVMEMIQPNSNSIKSVVSNHLQNTKLNDNQRTSRQKMLNSHQVKLVRVISNQMRNMQ